MLTKLTIQNYKSIVDLTVELGQIGIICRRPLRIMDAPPTRERMRFR